MPQYDINNVHYAGFWIRFAAVMIDTILLMAILMPVLIWMYGMQAIAQQQTGLTGTLISYLLPVGATLIFWHYRSATPGKMALKLEIVDAETFKQPTTGQFVIRYVGYFVSTIPLCLGFLWVAFDPRKQAWHDKLANTVVIYA